MALYKTHQGWGIDWRDEFGIRPRRFVGQQQAARTLDARLRAHVSLPKARTKNFAQSLTLKCSHALEVWQASYAGSPRTKTHQAARISVLIRDLLDPHIANLTPKLSQAWSAKRSTEVAPCTRACYHLLIRRWLDSLVRNGCLPSNPASGLDTRCPKPRPCIVLTYEQEGMVLASVTERIRLKLVLALDTGARLGELHALRKNHFAAAQNVLTIWSTKTRTLRQVPLTARARAACTQLAAGCAPDALLFTYGSRPVKKGSDFLKKLWPRVGFRFRFHDLRHTFATRLAAVAPNPFVVSALLGHASRAAMTVLHHAALSQTTTLYVHPQLDELRRAIQAMEAANPQAAGHQADPSEPTTARPGPGIGPEKTGPGKEHQK